uniref:Uncharacterized protein n=1 Tax=Anguilla anguilla TaxID=7936 RepID=A0A0E9QGY1_ANGAN
MSSPAVWGFFLLFRFLSSKLLAGHAIYISHY